MPLSKLQQTYKQTSQQVSNDALVKKGCVIQSVLQGRSMCKVPRIYAPCILQLLAEQQVCDNCWQQLLLLLVALP